jgi:hypothetical protein
MATEEITPKTQRVYKLRTNKKRASYEDRPIMDYTHSNTQENNDQSAQVVNAEIYHNNMIDSSDFAISENVDHGSSRHNNTEWREEPYSSETSQTTNYLDNSDTYETSNEDIASHNETYNEQEADNENYALTNDEYTDVLSYIPQPNRWVLSIPEDTSLPQLINFFRGNELVGVLPLTQDNANALVPVLQKHANIPVEKEHKKPLHIRAIEEWKAHKFIGSIAALIVGFVLFEIIGGLIVNGIY